MAKQVKKEAKPKAVVNTTAVNAITKALSDAYGSMAASGSLVHSCVQVARKFYKGKAIPTIDRDAIVNKLATARKWTVDSGRIRRNEADSILRAYAVIPELIKKFAKKNGGLIAWHEVVSLCRKFNSKDGGTVLKAVALVRKRSPAKASGAKVTVAEAKKRAAIACKALLKLTRLPKDFRAELTELCEYHGIKV